MWSSRVLHKSSASEDLLDVLADAPTDGVALMAYRSAIHGYRRPHTRPIQLSRSPSPPPLGKPPQPPSSSAAIIVANVRPSRFLLNIIYLPLEPSWAHPVDHRSRVSADPSPQGSRPHLAW